MTIDALIAAATLPIKRERRLPFQGQVLVDLGEYVHPKDIIAEASIPSQLHVLDIAKALGLEPSQTDACLVRDVNEPLEQGDVIAQYEGVVSRLVRMPVNGRLVSYDQGLAYLATDAVITTLQAGMIGKVESITPGFGAVISVVGSLLQGVWGNGQLGTGILQVLPAQPEVEQEEVVGDTAEAGCILALGGCWHKDDLEAYLNKGVTGLILGSLCPELVPFAEGLPFPVIVLQGFGELPADTIRFQLLAARSGSVACINACAGDSFSGAPAEVVIPQPQGEIGEQAEIQKMAVGQLVQVAAGQHQGKTGIVKEIPAEPAQFESGLVVPGTVVHLVSGEQLITVPRSNLIVIG